MGTYPAFPRILTAALAFLVLAQAAWSSVAAEADGFPRTGAATWLAAAVFAGFLLTLAVVPGEVEALAPRRSPLDLRRPAHHGAMVAAATAFYVLLGQSAIVETVHLLERRAAGTDVFTPTSEGALLAGLAFTGVILLGAPVVWVAAMRPGGRVLAALGLRREGAWRALAFGTLAALVAIAALAAVFVALDVLLGWTPAPNERALGIGRTVTVAGALLVAAGASVTEEVFFRGWLQPRIGVLGQALVFTAAHLNYLHVGETVSVFLLAILFGLLYRAVGNLWAPIAAHFAFNLVMLLAASAA